MSDTIKLVYGANHPTYTITWTDEAGTAVNLTGATITGRIKNTLTGSAAALTGTLALVTAASGIFSYIPSSTDTSRDASKHYVLQFIATFGDATIEKTFKVPCWIEEAI